MPVSVIPDSVIPDSTLARYTQFRYTRLPLASQESGVPPTRWKPCTYSLSSTAALLFAQWEVTDNF